MRTAVRLLLPLGSSATSGTTYETPSYDNAGGTGDRTSIITASTSLTLDGGDPANVSSWVDGVVSMSGRYWLAEAVATKFIRFHFLSNAVLITECKSYLLGDIGNNGTWKFQGSHDGSAWVDIGSSFLLPTTATDPTTLTQLSGNTTAYEYYQLLGISGNTSASYCSEFEFKIGNPI